MVTQRKWHIRLGFFLLIIVFSACSSTQHKLNELAEKRLLLANIKMGGEALEEFPEYKAEAALNISAILAGFHLIPNEKRDSVLRIMAKSDGKVSLYDAALKLNAGKLLFLQVDRLGKMIRTELLIVDVKTSNEQRGTGYALAHFVQERTQTTLYDPAIQIATQRAFAVAIGDSLLYASLESGPRVVPAKTLVITGLEYRENKNLEEWNLFQKKEVASFDAIETIFMAAKDSPKYVAYDNSSRDSIYALFKLHIPENFKAPTMVELSALMRLDVHSFITGEFKRTDEGAELTLMLCHFQDKKVSVLKTETAILTEDSTVKFRELLTTLTRKLLEFTP